MSEVTYQLERVQTQTPILESLTNLGIIKVGTNPRPHEVDYVATLNRALPDQIRVLGWTPVPAEFNARSSTLFYQTVVLIPFLDSIAKPEHTTMSLLIR